MPNLSHSFGPNASGLNIRDPYLRYRYHTIRLNSETTALHFLSEKDALEAISGRLV